MLYNTEQLRALARAYLDAVAIPPSRLGIRCANNDKLIIRLLDGRGCTLDAAERASWWLEQNWPEQAVWPKTVPDGRGM
jgi:hypothetical protein